MGGAITAIDHMVDLFLQLKIKSAGLGNLHPALETRQRVRCGFLPAGPGVCNVKNQALCIKQICTDSSTYNQNLPR